MDKGIIHTSTHKEYPKGKEVEGKLLDWYDNKCRWMRVLLRNGVKRDIMVTPLLVKKTLPKLKPKTKKKKRKIVSEEKFIKNLFRRSY